MSTHSPGIEIPFCDQGGAATGQFNRGELNELAFENARRIQQSLTASAEKRLLTWMAVRLPPWINSDHLTALGSTGMALAGLSYAVSRWHREGLILATVFLAINWLGDSLDGTLARVRDCQRPRYGFYLDHVVDTFGAAFLMTGLAVSGYMHATVALGLLVAFLMLSTEVYLATYTLGRFQLSFWRFGPTEIRILLAVGNLFLLAHPLATVAGRTYLLFDVGGVVAIFGMLVMMIVSAVRHTVQLYREERLP
jgi:phosphatidylglycerophosphate synthase